MSQCDNQENQSKSPANKKKVSNERAFEKIDSEEKAYWLGYLSADGCVTRDSRLGHNVSLGSIALVVIREFMRFIWSSHAICENNKNDNAFYTIRIGSKVMCEDLSKYGVIPKKTKSLKAFYFPDKSLFRHFIRGYTDGDGNISISNDSSFNRKLFSYSVYGNESVIKWFSDFLKDECNLRSSSWYKQDSITRYTRTQNQALKICDYLYEDAKVFLPRKKQKYLDFKRTRN